MTAPTIALQGSATPGQVSKRRVVALASRTPTVGVFKFTSGTTVYPTGGEDISSIWTYFRNVLDIKVQQVTATAASRRDFSVDLTNKLLLIYSAFNTQNTNADLSAICDDVRLIVLGYK